MADSLGRAFLRLSKNLLEKTPRFNYDLNITMFIYLLMYKMFNYLFKF